MSVSNKTVLWLVVILLVVVVFCMWNKKQEKLSLPKGYSSWADFCNKYPKNIRCYS